MSKQELVSGWKAEQFRGKINAGQFCPATLSLLERESGMTITDKWPEGRANCMICGNRVWHYWQFAAGGETLLVGVECARVVCGDTPAKFLQDLREREAFAQWEREQAQQAEQFREWWHAPETYQLRRNILIGARIERQARAGADFYQRALESVRNGRLSEKYQAWILRAGPADVVATRTSTAMSQLRDLIKCRTGMYDGPIIKDLYDRVFPGNPKYCYGAPLSEKQCAMIAKFAHKYRKQINDINAQFAA